MSAARRLSARTACSCWSESRSAGLRQLVEVSSECRVDLAELGLVEGHAVPVKVRAGRLDVLDVLGARLGELDDSRDQAGSEKGTRDRTGECGEDQPVGL